MVASGKSSLGCVIGVILVVTTVASLVKTRVREA